MERYGSDVNPNWTRYHESALHPMKSQYFVVKSLFSCGFPVVFLWFPYRWDGGTTYRRSHLRLRRAGEWSFLLRRPDGQRAVPRCLKLKIRLSPLGEAGKTIGKTIGTCGGFMGFSMGFTPCCCQKGNYWLVVFLEHEWLIFPETLGNGISSSQLTNSYFSVGLKPPTRLSSILSLI